MRAPLIASSIRLGLIIGFKGPFSATPVAAGNFLYCVSAKGVAQVVDITKPEGEVVNELDLAEILCTPSIAGGAIYLRTDTRLWKLRNRKIEESSVKAYGQWRRPPRPFDLPIWNIKLFASFSLSWNMKSEGKRSMLRLTALLRLPVVTP